MTLAAETLLPPARAQARTAAHAGFVVRTVETREAFAALQPEWDRLAERASITPMARHDWLLTAADAFAWRRLAVVTVQDAAGTLRAAAPFAVTGFGPFKRMVWLSHEMGEPQTLLYDGADALEALVRAAADLRLPLTARRLTPKDGELAVVERSLGRRGLC